MTNKFTQRAKELEDEDEKKKNRFVQTVTKGNSFERQAFKKLTGKDRKVSPFVERVAEKKYDTFKAQGVDTDKQAATYGPESRPMTEEDWFDSWTRWLHSPTPKAEGAWDFVSRVVPNSLVKTATGITEFPYHLAKGITDPAMLLVDDWSSHLKGFEKSVSKIKKERERHQRITGKSPKTSLTNDILEELWHTDKKMYRAALARQRQFSRHMKEQADGFARFFGEGIGIYGWDKMKEKWLTDPVGALIGITPYGKGGRNLVQKAGRKGKTFEGKNIFQKAYDMFDVQGRFNRSNLKRTGEATKNLPSVKNAEQNRAIDLTKKFKKQKLSVEDSIEVTIQAGRGELKRSGKDNVLKATKDARNYFEKAGDRVISDKIMKDKWPHSHITENANKINILKSDMKTLARIARKNRPQKPDPMFRKDVVKELQRQEKFNKARDGYIKSATEMRELQKVNKLLKDVDPRYVYIPYPQWTQQIKNALGDTIGQRTVNNILSKYKGRYFKKRNTIDIADIINDFRKLKDPKGNPIFDPKDFTIQNVVANYAEKIGSMRGFAKIFNAAKQEGAIVYSPSSLKKKDGKVVVRKDGTPVRIRRSPEPGFGEPSKALSDAFPELKDHYIHNAFNDYMTNYIRKVDSSFQLGRILGYTKMMAFYNPVILPMYDLYQMNYTGMTLELFGKDRMTKNMAEGFKSALTRDQKYYRALENGAMSTPYTPPFKNFKAEMMGSIKGKFANNMLRGLEKRVKNPAKLIDDFYKPVWNMAWTGDGMVRMSTWNYLKKKGLGDRDAAQYTAYFHGDYARLTPTARKWLNKIMFTPSFKYSMGHLQANMIKSSVKVARDALTLKNPAQRDLMLGKAGLMLVGNMMAKDLVMQNVFGFKVDDTGLRYTREVETDKGKQELVLYSSDPHNTWLRQVHRWTQWQDNPEQLHNIIYKGHWDLHPLWRTMVSIALNNKGDRTDPAIWNTNDDIDVTALNILHYSTRQLVGVVKPLEDIARKKGPKEAYRVMRDEIGTLHSTFLQATMLAYLRNPKNIRIAHKIRALEKNFRSEQYSDAPKTNKEADMRRRNLQKKIAELNKELNDYYASKKPDKPKNQIDKNVPDYLKRQEPEPTEGFIQNER